MASEDKLGISSDLITLVCKTDSFSSIYRKPTFTGQYIRWNSFCPMKRKTNLISILVHRALVIYSKSTLQKELSNIRSILINKGYPESIINTFMTKKTNQFCITLEAPYIKTSKPNLCKQKEFVCGLKITH